MKINKLFHWLYAFIMFIPIFAIFISCGYVMFNKNAYESYSGSVYPSFEDVAVTSFDEMVNGHTYVFISNNSQTINSNSKTISFTDFEFIEYSSVSSFNEDMLSASAFTTTFYDGRAYLVPIVEGVNKPALDMYARACSFKFTLVSNSNPSNNTFTECWDNFITQRVYNDYHYQDNVFYFSIDQLKQNSLFNWSKNSFLAEPITYITDLFGVDNDNLIIYLMSYWLDISLIWLVFDLVMYVPLLVHRWLDKGVID